MNESAPEKIALHIPLDGQIGYRSKDGLAFLKTQDPPRKRLLFIEHQDGTVVEYEEVLERQYTHNKHYDWISLGIGIVPKKAYGLRKALHDLAFGYLSGFPAKDVLSYVFNFSLSRRRAEHLLRKEGHL